MTLSPFFTIGVAGAPICCPIGNTATFGRPAGFIASEADNLFSAGCTPPILKVFTIFGFSVFLY